MSAGGELAGNVGRFGSGRGIRRVEDDSLVRGAGFYAGDTDLAETAYLVFVRSSYAHARIVSIDAQAARAMPGVLAVVTGADLVNDGVAPLPIAVPFRRPDGSALATPARRALAFEVARFVGEGVAAVIARSRDQAQAAAATVHVDYEELPAVAGAIAAAAPGAPLVWQEATGNVCAMMRHGDAQATEAAFARAAHVTRLKLTNQRLAPSPMEPRSVVASFEPADGRITIRMSSQMPTGVRDTLADAVLGISKDKVRVVVGDVGGGFGMKTGIYPEDVVVAWSARHLARPVKWIAERSEEFLAAIHGRDLESDAEMALDEQGRVLAVRVRSLAGIGAYATATAVAIQLMIGPWVLPSIYDIQTIDLEIRAILSHMPPTGAYRGAGRPESIYIIERLMDAAAREMAIDPAELRRRNMISPGQMPYRNALGQTYDSGNFESLLEQGLVRADWSGFEGRLADSARRGRLRGRGIATFLEWTGGNVLEEQVRVNVTAEGIIEIISATQAMGQGIATSYAQLAVDVFQVPIERIRILQGDTDRATGFGSAGSRSLFTGGSAVRVAALRTIDDARELAAEALEASATDLEYDAGEFRVAGTDLAIDLFSLAARQKDSRIEVKSSAAAAGPTWPNGCHICEVEVDPETGVVTLESYTSINDVGRVINPVIVVGQLEGGAVQGIGQALYERVVYDEHSGQALTASFLDYALPHADVVRQFTTVLDESTPCLTNVLGVKGVGELGTIGATPAVVNAVIDALARTPLGLRAQQIQMPLTSARIWEAIHAAT
jgi:carbon-monoxide dehydrogenase large subunit